MRFFCLRKECACDSEKRFSAFAIIIRVAGLSFPCVLPSPVVEIFFFCSENLPSATKFQSPAELALRVLAQQRQDSLSLLRRLPQSWYAFDACSSSRSCLKTYPQLKTLTINIEFPAPDRCMDGCRSFHLPAVAAARPPLAPLVVAVAAISLLVFEE